MSELLLPRWFVFGSGKSKLGENPAMASGSCVLLQKDLSFGRQRDHKWLWASVLRVCERGLLRLGALAGTSGDEL